MQRRLAQNREAARKCRLRKKAYVQQLESSRLKLAQMEQELQRARQQEGARARILRFNLGFDCSSRMASSPTSSRASSSSSLFTPSKFESLPIMAMRDKIVEKIMENRVTLIVGETGCGKTSQVPLFLREEGMTPIICTQPRRFAVVAVAKTVAKFLQSDVGDEVGYHIGHCRVTSSRTKIVYKTAGVLLEEMRQNGLNALKYKVIILDEVHERSIESDLALVCLKQFLLRKTDIRLVLMSATADISKYRDYFNDLGRGERVEVLAIPSSKSTIYFPTECVLP